MSLVNLKIARKLSKQQYLRYWKYSKSKKFFYCLSLHLTLTANNFVVNLTNGIGQTLLCLSMGQLGYSGYRQRHQAGFIILGRSVIKKIYKLRYRRISLYIHSGQTKKNSYRLRKFLVNFRAARIRFSKIIKNLNIPYNGCRLSHLRRTGRRLRFF